MTNHPIQGSAAVVFKMAGNRLDRLVQELNSKLIIAFHDAYVFEAPLEQMERVAQLIKQEMIRAVQEIYPMLRPRADINIDCPECWNKDGKADSIKQWLAKLAPKTTLRTEETDAASNTDKLAMTGPQHQIDGMFI